MMVAAAFKGPAADAVKVHWNNKLGPALLLFHPKVDVGDVMVDAGVRHRESSCQHPEKGFSSVDATAGDRVMQRRRPR